MSCTLNLDTCLGTDQVDGALSSSNLLESKNKTTHFFFLPINKTTLLTRAFLFGFIYVIRGTNY